MKKTVTGKRKRYGYWGYLFISPWILGFLLLQLYPLLDSLRISFTDYNMLSDPRFVGLKNYIQMFTRDDNFYHSVSVTLASVFLVVPLKLIFALLIALLLNSNVRGINLYRTAYYLPSIFGGSVAIAVLWRFLFMREGLVNEIIAKIGLPPVDWLGSPYMALFTVSLVSVWQFGASMVIFLAGLKQVPGELYESAKMDGAGVFQRFFHVSLPMISPVLFFNVIMQIINAMQEFTTPFVVTKGGPAKGTYLFAMMIYENGFKFLKMGYSSALSWIMFIAVMILTMMVFKSSNYWVYYNDGGKE